MEAMVEFGRPMTPSDIADEIGKSKQYTHKVLGQLVDLGKVERSATQGKYIIVPDSVDESGELSTP